MRLSVILLVCSLAGVVGGGALIGRWALGLAVIADSIAVGVFALLRDAESRPRASGLRAVPGHQGSTVAQVFERARAS